MICLLFSNLVYALDFDQFDVNDINAVKKAAKYYQKEYKNKRGTKEAEEDYLRFSEFLLKFENTQSKKIYLPYDTSNNSIRKQIAAYSNQYYKYGLVAQFDEGEFMLVSSNHYIYENFAPYLSKPWKEILKFNSSDKRNKYDGRYIVPKSYLKNQMKFYKNFIKKYPDLVYYTSQNKKGKKYGK